MNVGFCHEMLDYGFLWYVGVSVFSIQSSWWRNGTILVSISSTDSKRLGHN